MQRNKMSRETRAEKTAELQAMATAALALETGPHPVETQKAALQRTETLVMELTASD
jgi:hypothetical protein